MEPSTIHDLLARLEDYHHKRQDRYRDLSRQGAGHRLGFLMDELVELEGEAIEQVEYESRQLSPKDLTRLARGPQLQYRPGHTAACHCDVEPTFEDAVMCALGSDEPLNELIDRIESATAANSIRELASRLREMERIRGRQISKYLRDD